MPFSPNSGYAFAVGSDSWHSADPVGPHVKTRDSILHTYFVDQGLLRIVRNRGRRVGNFVTNEVRGLVRRSRDSLDAVALDRGLVPDDADARPVGNDRVAVNDLQRLLHDLVGPVDVFEEMRGRRHREQMRARLRIEMR